MRSLLDRVLAVALSSNYQAFGLNFYSEIELPEFFEYPGAPVDVTLRSSSVEGHAVMGPDHPVAFSSSPGYFLFERYQVARFEVRDGASIVVDSAPEADPAEVRAYLLGTVMAALLQQRGILALHASAVEVDGSAVLFAGVSGVGKSTLAAAFFRAGYTVLADDVCAIHWQQERAVIYPALRRLKLWREAALNLQLEPDNLESIQPARGERYALPLTTPQLHARSLKAVFLLVPWAGAQSSCQKASGSRLFNLLYRATYRPGLLNSLGATASHFQMTTRVTQQAQVGLLCRPQQAFAIEELMETALEALRG